MNAIERLRERLPEAASDLQLNLGAVLETTTLGADQKWLVALACAFASANAELREAVLSDARLAAPEAVIEDARAAAALMGMNNVFYRFRHFMGATEKKETYTKLPARLRMNRIVRPLTNKADFELACLAVSAINGCETCVVSHEATVAQHGITAEQVQDAVRIAAVMHGVACALGA